MAEQLRVFVSHSHQDNDFCHAIVQALRDAGADVWYDEHNLGWGQLKDVIILELGQRPIFVLILSKAVFNSRWVKREADWAEELADRDPSRVMLPVTAGPIERDDFGTKNGWLFLHGYKRIEAPGLQPYPIAEAITKLLHALGLILADTTTAPIFPQPAEDVDDLLTRGKALLAQKQFGEAMPHFERATQLASDSFDAWANLGWVLGEVGHWQAALTACERALAIDDKQAWVWNNKGNALYMLNLYAEALTAYDRALSLAPLYMAAWTNKGLALNNLSIHARALLAYTDAHYHAEVPDPNYRVSLHKKAATLRALGRTAEADAAEKRARELG